MTDFASKHAACRIKLFKELAKLLDTGNWSDELISKAETHCGFTADYHHIIFADGKAQMLQEFESWQDQIMINMLEKIEKPKKIREQIALALEIRLMEVVSKNVTLNNSAFFMIPTNILTGNESACHTCDLIWKYTGDKSTDFNYYTKRGLLLPVYLSARAFYFADDSKNHQATREFIKNALDNIINIASFKNKINLPKIEDIPILRLFS
jgi:ubiquinone biosynthesis protein COQ9